MRQIRSAANTSSSVLGNLKNGEKVTVLGKANGWAKINYQGKEGYVSLEFFRSRKTRRKASGKHYELDD
ncbi:SH3 domain-containing protein [Bacillus sp. FSL M7-1020]|uniref:SH3 domain-containing protein n=1 Tax=Bacillus sp. FSL M7-1020 TaxID=2921540 RepID=UPI0031016AEA